MVRIHVGKAQLPVITGLNISNRLFRSVFVFNIILMGEKGKS